MNRLIPCLTALLIGAGCVPIRRGGTTHYLIIGLGVVSVPSTNSPAAQIIQSHAIGLSMSDQPGIKLGMGYAANTTIKICTNQNLVVEVSARPGRPLKVKTE